MNENCCIFKFAVSVDIDLLKSKMPYRGLSYKYVVFSKRMEEVGHPYEYLYGNNTTGDTNRVLKLREEKIFSTGKQL